MDTASGEQKSRVLAINAPEYSDKAYLAEFQSSFDLHILGATNRQQAKDGIAQFVAEFGAPLAIIMFFGTRPFEPFDEDLLRPLVPDCKLFVSASAGFNEFDVHWMTENGMWFCNTRDGVAEATADMTIFLLLAVLRDTSRAEKSARAGTWKNNFKPTCDPFGKTLGVIGMGSIGKYVARKAAVFNLKVQYFSRNRLPLDVEKSHNISYCSSIKELLNSSDIVSLHVPLNATTTNLISENEFAEMKDGAFLINTARGPIVNEAAMIAALKSGKVRRVGLDVFEDEPNINPWIKASDLCVIQPHLGGLTDEAWRRAEKECFENIKAFHRTGKALSPVNNPK